MTAIPQIQENSYTFSFNFDWKKIKGIHNYVPKNTFGGY